MGTIFFFEKVVLIVFVYINKLIGFLNARSFLGYSPLMLSLFVVLFSLIVC